MPEGYAGTKEEVSLRHTPVFHVPEEIDRQAVTQAEKGGEDGSYLYMVCRVTKV